LEKKSRIIVELVANFKNFSFAVEYRRNSSPQVYDESAENATWITLVSRSSEECKGSLFFNIKENNWKITLNRVS